MFRVKGLSAAPNPTWERTRSEKARRLPHGRRAFFFEFGCVQTWAEGSKANLHKMCTDLLVGKPLVSHAIQMDHEVPLRFQELGQFSLEALGVPTSGGALQSDRPMPAPDRDQLLAIASLFRFLRARRTDFLPAEMFGEPAWDALLMLYIRPQGTLDPTTLEVAAATGVPITTALRWIESLQNMELIERDERPGECHQSCIRLSAAGESLLDHYLRCIYEDIARLRCGIGSPQN